LKILPSQGEHAPNPVTPEKFGRYRHLFLDRLPGADSG
jgi:hypothetical protein